MPEQSGDADGGAPRGPPGALDSAREMLRLVMDTVPQFLCWKDRNSVFLGCNANYARLVGLPDPQAIVGKTDWDLPWKPEQTRCFLEHDRFVMESDRPMLHIIEPARDAAGRAAWLDTTKVPLRDAQGGVVGILVAIEDITDRVQDREALRRSEERYRQLVENAPLGIFSADRTGAVRDVNPELLKILGSPSAEATRQFNVLSMPAMREAGLSDDLRRCLDTGESFVSERRYLTQWNKPTFLRCHLRPLRDPDGTVTGIQAIVEDVSAVHRVQEEKDRLEEQLRQSQKMEAIGRLAGGVAHDFNNILTGIMGLTEMMITAAGPDHPLAADLREVHGAGGRAAALTARLLAFSRRQLIAPRVLDLNALLASLEKMAARLIGEDVELVLVPGAQAGWVRADPGQLEQAVVNLLVNARDAMPGGGRLTVETANATLGAEDRRSHPDARPGRYVVLSVADTGHGMSPEVRERLFEPFFTTKEKGQGTGLGLSMVYGTVRQNGGFIEVSSDPGRGSTFRLHLPCVEGPDVQERPPARQTPGGSETVLLVEDEAMVRELARRVLQQQGYTVLVASGGGEALALAARHPAAIDLLLTDVVMPGLNGREVGERLRELRPGVACLFMSGYTDDVIAHHGILEAGLHFLPKPFTVEGLARKVREVLDGRARDGAGGNGGRPERGLP